MEEAELSLRDRSELRHYARLMARTIDGDVWKYGPLGSLKRPKKLRNNALRIYFGRDSYAEQFGIRGKYGLGRWKLEMVGSNEMPGSRYCDIGYNWILPLLSDNVNVLDFLARDALPSVFEDKEFRVISNLVSVDGDCSWDCK